MILNIVMGFIFIAITFLAYASNILFLWELIPLAFLLLPVYLYCRKRKLLNVFFAVGTVYTGARFYMNMLLTKQHADMILLPISINQPIIKQFTGITVIIALFIWHTYILYASLISIKDRCSKITNYKDLVNDSQIQRFSNLCKSTTVIVLLEIVAFIWMYDLTSVASRMITFMLVIIVMAFGFDMLVNKLEVDKKILFSNELTEALKRAQDKYKVTDALDEDMEGFEVIDLDEDERDHNSEE